MRRVDKKEDRGLNSNKWKLWIVIFLLIFCQGCAEMPRLNSEETVVPPKNKKIPLQGLWEIKDFKPISNEDAVNEDIEGWVGQKAIFTESLAVLGNERCSDAEYKIRTVDSREYLLFHYGVDPRELKVTQPKTDIISVSSNDKPFYDFIVIEEELVMVYAYGGFYILDKQSDTVDNTYIDNSIDAEEKREEEKKEDQDLLRSGVLLGLRSTANISGDGQENSLRSTYRTLWIASYNRELHPILEVPDLFVPRRSGFWRVGIKIQKFDEYMQDFLFAYSMEQEFHSQSEENGELKKQQGDIVKNILFVGDDYVALEYSNILNSETRNSRFKVLPLDDINSEQGIRISDIAGKDRKNIFYESAEAHLLSNGLKIPGKLEEIAKEDNFTLSRRNGHWILRGRINYDNSQEDFTIGLSPVGKLINYDELYIPWDTIKEKIPAAVDAYTSPNKDIILVITSSFIEIYAVKDGKIADRPLRRINIRRGETVVMAEWATGEYVARWEKSLNQLNPFIINDY